MPIYNVAKYLKECIDSLKAQTYTNIAFVLVNDGSTDESLSLAYSLTKSDNRFVIINKQNGGVSSARNAGLDFAFESLNGQKGYIGFLDSDDIVSFTFYENLIKALKRHRDNGGELLIAKSRSVQIFDDKNYDLSNFSMNKKYMFSWSVRPNRANFKHLKHLVWLGVYDSELLKNLRFAPFSLAEDVCFCFCANALADKIIFTRDARIFYRSREGSAMKLYKANVERINVLSFKECMKFFKTHNLIKKCGVPSSLLRKSLLWFSDVDSYLNDEGELQAIKEVLQDLPSDLIEQDRILKSAKSAKTMREFVLNTCSFKEKLKLKFRFKISKKQIIIKLFGKVIYQNKAL